MMCVPIYLNTRNSFEEEAYDAVESFSSLPTSTDNVSSFTYIFYMYLFYFVFICDLHMGTYHFHAPDLFFLFLFSFCLMQQIIIVISSHLRKFFHLHFIQPKETRLRTSKVFRRKFIIIHSTFEHSLLENRF